MTIVVILDTLAWTLIAKISRSISYDILRPRMALSDL
jgi:hypothetical protein